MVSRVEIPNGSESRKIDLARWICLIGLVHGIGGVAGCTSSVSEADRFVPDPVVARQAVETMLDRWKAGATPSSIADRSPQLVVVDSVRQAGAKLAWFEILGEVPGESSRCLAVRLVMGDPPVETTTRYVVVGIDPLYLFRHEDFELLMHWDHPMPANAEEDTTQSATTKPPATAEKSAGSEIDDPDSSAGETNSGESDVPGTDQVNTPAAGESE